jgi:hypothetical protein
MEYPILYDAPKTAYDARLPSWRPTTFVSPFACLIRATRLKPEVTTATTTRGPETLMAGTRSNIEAHIPLHGTQGRTLTFSSIEGQRTSRVGTPSLSVSILNGAGPCLCHRAQPLCRPDGPHLESPLHGEFSAFARVAHERSSANNRGLTLARPRFRWGPRLKRGNHISDTINAPPTIWNGDTRHEIAIRKFSSQVGWSIKYRMGHPVTGHN